MPIKLTPRLCRAARALLGWQQQHVVEASGVSKSTLGAFETKDEAAYLTTMNNKALVEAFERAGIEFIPANGGGAGLRLKSGARPVSLPRDLAEVLAAFSTHRLSRTEQMVGVGELRFVIAGSQATLMEDNETIGMISVRAHEVVFSPELPTGRSGRAPTSQKTTCGTGSSPPGSEPGQRARDLIRGCYGKPTCDARVANTPRAEFIPENGGGAGVRLRKK